MKVSEMSEKLQQQGSIAILSKELLISEKRVRSLAKNLGFVYNQSTKHWDYEGDEGSFENEVEVKVLPSTIRNTPDKISVSEKPVFTNDEIEVLKSLIREHKRDYTLFTKYRIYEELAIIPNEGESVRNAYNLSRKTTERLKEFANDRRLPLQDLVELAIIKLLEQYK